MSILLDVAKELFGMFWADASLATAILLLVALSAGLVIGFHANPLAGGALLLVGCVLILIEASVRGVRTGRLR